MLKVVHDEAEPNEASGSVLGEIVREAARQMLAVALGGPKRTALVDITSNSKVLRHG